MMTWSLPLVMLVLTAPAPVKHTTTAGPAAKVPVRDSTEREDAIDRLNHDIEKIERAIVETKQIIRLSLDAPYLPDLYFHLAELYVERSRFEHTRGLEQQGDGEELLSTERSLVVTITKKLAIETYDKVLTDFPDYDRRDQIYFFKGHELRELGDYPAMSTEYETLIDRYPRSKWALQARMILGDYHFDKGEYDPAEKYYKAILALNESLVHPSARYKMGWIRVNQQKFKDALDYFKDAVQSSDNFAREKKLAGGGKTVNVRREALMAMAWPYSETRRPSQAPAFFKALADSQLTYIDVIRKLANRYLVKSRPAAAALLYREVVVLGADPEENLEYVPRIINAVADLPADNALRYQTVDDDEHAITKTYVALRDRPEAVRKRADAPVLNEAEIATEYELHGRDLVTRAQKFAQNNNDRDLDSKAAKAYDRYIKAFTDAKDFETMELNRGGALFDAEEYLPAGEQYEVVAERNKIKVKSTDVYNACVAYYRALDEDAKHRAADPERNGTLDKLELLRAREGLKQLGSYYVKKFPESGKAPEVRFNIARMYYQGGDFAESVELFVAFIRDYPTNKDVGTAGRLALDALYKLERLDDLGSLAEKFAHDTHITDTEFKTEAAHLAENARKRKVEFAVLGTADADFSKKMISEFEKHKGSKEGEEYLYAGFSKYKSQGDIANTFTFGDKLIGAYPNSKWAPEVISTMGTFAAHVADFERAAWMYEEYQKRYPKEKGSVALVKNAGDIRRMLGELRQAEQDYTTLRQVGTPEERSYAGAKLLEMYAGAGSWGQLGAASGSFLEDGGSVSACFFAGLAEYKQSDMRNAKAHFQCAVRAPAHGDIDESFQARSAFELGRVAQAGFNALEFHGAQAAEQTLRSKLQLLNDTEQTYLNAIHRGDAQWALAATYELSRLYRQFGDFIVNAPAPANVSPDQYKTALAEQAEPYYDKAKQTLAACSQKAEQLKLLSAYGTACVMAQTREVDEKMDQPYRTATAQDTHYQSDLERIRQGLSRNVKNVDVLKSMARRAMAAGDWHYARLVLASIGEINHGQTIDGWMGLALWHLGEPQAAADYLDRARHNGDDQAGLNLAALYDTFGYKRAAKSVLPDAIHTKDMDLSSYEIHPAARRLLQGGSSGKSE